MRTVDFAIGRKLPLIAIVSIDRERFQMTDLDPEIFDNPTLGAAAPNENLDRLTAQQIEDRAAKFEGREPREIVVDNTYPGWKPDVSERTGTVPSNYQTVHFEDEQQADIPVDSGPEDGTAGGIDAENSEGSQEASSLEDGSDSQVDSGETDGVQEVGTPESASTEEGSPTQWS
jgi:hypothetical protein